MYYEISISVPFFIKLKQRRMEEAFHNVNRAVDVMTQFFITSFPNYGEFKAHKAQSITCTFPFYYMFMLYPQVTEYLLKFTFSESRVLT